MKKLYSAIIILITFATYSQDITQAVTLPDVVPPSPTVAALMHFEEVPVDLHTGQPDISLPLYSKPLNSELSFSLALKYSSLGVRVSEHSGWTGTNWSLIAGGVISRTIRGGADELDKGPDGNGSYKIKGVYYNSDFWNYETLTDQEKSEFNWRVNGTSQHVYDTQPDLYQFSFMGMSGRFTINPQTRQPILLSQDQKLKIDIYFDLNDVNGNGNTNEIFKFAITDANGICYEFGNSTNPELACETSQTAVQTTLISQKNFGFDMPQPPVPEETVSAWHLTKISTTRDDMTSTTLASFTYNQSNEIYTTPWSVTINELKPDYATMYNFHLQNVTNVTNYFRPRQINKIMTVTTNTQKLKEVIFQDNTKLVFIPTAQGSHIENGGFYLDKIQLKQGSTVKRTFYLNYENLSNRLWLMNVNVDNTQNYSFEYYQRNNVGAYGDEPNVWGFTNADYSYGDNIYFKRAYEYGILNKITYPTGGVKKFYYEPNTFTYEGADKIFDYSSNPLNLNPQYYSNYFQATQQGSVSGGTITLTHEQEINVSATSNSEYFYVYLSNGSNSENIALAYLPGKITLPAGTYTVSVAPFISQITAPYQTQNLTVNITYATQKPINSGSYCSYLLGGGTRIGSITFEDPQDTGETVKKKIVYDYDFYESDDVFHFNFWESSGAVDAKMGSMYKDYYDSDPRYLYTNTSNSTVNFYNIKYHVRTKEPNVQLTKGGYVSYGKVRVYEAETDLITGNLPAHGYTEYEYTTAKDFPSPEKTFEYPYLSPPNLDYKRGLLVKKSVYAVENNLAKLVEQTIIDKDTDYDYIEGENIKSFDLIALECKHKVFYDKYVNYVNIFPEYPMICQSSSEPGIYSPCFTYDNCTEVAPFILSSQQIRPGRAELKKSTTTYYPDGSSNGITKTTTYTYNPENYQIASEAYTINEGSVLNEYKTVYEYPVGGYTSSLFDSSDVSAINKMVVLNIINKPITITSYKNGSVLQRVINKYKDFSSNQVLLSEVETLKNGSATIGEDRIIYTSYGPKNNIQDVFKYNSSNSGHISYIWAYNHTLPVAKINGIAYSLINPDKRDAVENASTESALRNALQDLQNSYLTEEIQISTFLTDPVKGVIETVDPRGYKLKYTYDILGRLTKVNDETGKIISEYEYKYRGIF
ncbi:RHS repeat protein [Flavobacterium alkalisoli]|uniref:RHS repeat protein n=1 Tax=Flavobacterium alkalisoli TaxID=2602769 RepID=A0A5B9FQ57_9FLAO|nr:RHS repeat domain-containing protein [Flavobacterium alkalisoli]QEE48469.1 RHS repeat protein [Flavobacterium alkalisoli]